MRTSPYRLETQISQIKPTSTEWYKNYIREILESDKSYFIKCDYISISFNDIQKKQDYISAEIKELQSLKKSLANAKEIALIATADVLAEYGIEKIEGTTVSSITITPEKTKTKDGIRILDEEALITLGYAKVSVDEKAVAEAMTTIEGMDEIDKYVEVYSNTEIIPSRIKINKRRNNVVNQATELLKYTIEDTA